MAHVEAARVADTSITTGTGSFSVSGSAPSGFRTLSAVFSNGDTFYYVIAHQTLGEWEEGFGTFSGSNTFARTTVLSSSNADAAVNFSSGTKDVFVTKPANRDNPRLLGLTDNRLIRSDGTAGNVQQTGITVDDSNNVSGLNRLDFADSKGIHDAAGNEQILFHQTASAVNQLGVTNAATGTSVLLASEGNDTDSNLDIAGKGTGAVRHRDPAGSMSPTFGNVPQQSKSAAYTTVLTDANQHIYHPSSDNNARTFTIDSNANVAYVIGTTLTFINEINTVTIAITSDTLVLAGTGATGSRTLAANGMATAIKVTSTRWYISGTGLT